MRPYVEAMVVKGTGNSLQYVGLLPHLRRNTKRGNPQKTPVGIWGRDLYLKRVPLEFSTTRQVK